MDFVRVSQQFWECLLQTAARLPLVDLTQKIDSQLNNVHNVKVASQYLDILVAYYRPKKSGLCVKNEQ